MISPRKRGRSCSRFTLPPLRDRVYQLFCVRLEHRLPGIVILADTEPISGPHER